MKGRAALLEGSPQPRLKPIGYWDGETSIRRSFQRLLGVDGAVNDDVRRRLAKLQARPRKG